MSRTGNAMIGFVKGEPMTQTEDEKAAKEYCDKEFQDVYDPWSEKRSFLAGTKHGREAERQRIWEECKGKQELAETATRLKGMVSIRDLAIIIFCKEQNDQDKKD